jgi:hypothetical protein
MRKPWDNLVRRSRERALRPRPTPQPAPSLRFDQSRLVGLTEAEARAACAAEGLRLRVMPAPGAAVAGSPEWRSNRLNVRLGPDGRVATVSGLG